VKREAIQGIRYETMPGLCGEHSRRSEKMPLLRIQFPKVRWVNKRKEESAYRVHDTLRNYPALRGLPPAFVLRIPAILRKYSGPRFAVTLPPILPSTAAGSMVNR